MSIVPSGPLAPAITMPGSVTCQSLSNHCVQLQNDWLSLTLDSQRGAAATSLVYRPLNLDLAICDSYQNQVLHPFRECLHLQPMYEGRIGSAPQPFTLLPTAGQPNRAQAVFEGSLVSPQTDGALAPYQKLQLTKTFTLTADQPTVDLDYRLVNQGSTALPVSLWMSHGVRIPEEDVQVFAPAPQGLMSAVDRWHDMPSSFLNLPQAAAPWTAAVGMRAPNVGLYTVWSPGQIESIYDWLGKFPGFTLGAGTPIFTLQPGQELVLPTRMGVIQGMTRIDATWPDLVCSLDLPNPTPDQSVPLTLSLAAPAGGAFTARVTLRHLPDRRPLPVGQTTLTLQPGIAGSAAMELRFPSTGTYLFTVQLRDAAGQTRQCQRAVTVGHALEVFQHRPPKLLGKPYWAAHHLEKPLPAWTQRCNRKLQFPSIPWSTPRIPRNPRPRNSQNQHRPRILFLGEVGWSTAVFRTLGQQGDLEWDLVNLGPMGEYGTGPYGRPEIRKALAKLRRFKPDAVLTAGLRFDDLPLSFALELRARVQAGMGLVCVVSQEQHLGVWPTILQDAKAQVIPQPVSPLLLRLFDRHIAPQPVGQTQAWTLGQGRFISVVKALDWPTPAIMGDGASRNDLLPRYRGRTELPDWEYHLAQYLQLLNVAIRCDQPVQITDLSLTSAIAQLACQSQSTQTVRIQMDLLSTDLLSQFHIEQTVTLTPGDHQISIPLPDCPASEYVAHLQILDPQSGAVLAFDATCADITSDHCIQSIDLSPPRNPRKPRKPENPRLRNPLNLSETPGNIPNIQEAIPSSITVQLQGNFNPSIQVQAELRHAQDDRIVWQQTLPAAERVTFTDIHFQPLSDQSLLAIRVMDGSRVLTQQSRRLRAWKPGNVAEEELAFLTAAGGEHDWYATRMVLPWALESGFDFTFLRYSMDRASFPWKRLKHNQLDPSITDTTELHQQLHQQIEDEFHQHGQAYFCLKDEFILGDEFDWSEPTLHAFAQYMLEQLGSLDALNRQWNTRFNHPQEIRPQLIQQARQNPDHPGPWLDFRLFMDQQVARRYQVASEEAARISPLIKVGESGMYAPGLHIGLDYYRMCQAGRFFMNYAGQRCDWVRSFAHPDAILGVWLGYGWQQPQHPWDYLFKRLHILAWWGYLPRKPLAHMAAIGIDLTPGTNFQIIGRDQAQIRQGLGRLFQLAKPTEPSALIAHSQASIYCSELLGRSNHQAADTLASLLTRHDLSYAYLADAQVQQGRLESASSALLILPGIEALDPQVAQAYAQAHKRGCPLLADAEPAVRNQHGRRLDLGQLDDCWGITARGTSRQQPQPLEPIQWTRHAPTPLANLQGQMVRAVDQLHAPSDRVWAQYLDGTPAILGHRNSSGALAILFNTRLEWSHQTAKLQALNPEDRPDELSASQTISALFDFLIADAKLKPALTVEPAERSPKQSTHLKLGQCSYFGVILGQKSGPVTVTFPQSAHTYDCRAGRYLGLGHQFTQSFQARQIAKVYAQLPYRVTGITARFQSPAVRPGEPVTLLGQVHAHHNPTTETHVIHAQVISPDGQRPRFLSQNIAAPQGRFEYSFPTALNDQPGQWTVELTDTATGKRHLATWELLPPATPEAHTL